jgi:hypothetical protein
MPRWWRLQFGAIRHALRSVSFLLIGSCLRWAPLLHCYHIAISLQMYRCHQIWRVIGSSAWFAHYPPYSLVSVSSVSSLDSRVALGPALSVVKGMSNLPVPKENFYALSRKVVVPNNTSVATASSIGALLVFDTPRLDALPAEPPIFVACLAGKCQGGPEFKCNKGYTGILCSECEPEQFYWNGRCDTSCEDISPRGVTTVLGIIAVIIVWLILNKSAGGMYVSAHASEKTK